MILVKIMEECDEVSQRCAKALRFTLEEVQPGQNLNNANRIIDELQDLLIILDYAQMHGVIGDFKAIPIDQFISKRERIEKYLEYSKSVGTLTENE